MLPSLHYQTDVPLGGDEPDPSDVASAIWTHIGTAFRACFSSGVTVHTFVCAEEVLPPSIGVAGSTSVELGGTAGASGDAIPQGITPIINLHTNARSRSARGWMHLPPPPGSANINTNTFTSTHLTRMTTLCALLDDVLDLGTVFVTHVNPVVYSRTRHANGLEPYTFQVKSATANPTPHWLRSRMTTP